MAAMAMTVTASIRLKPDAGLLPLLQPWLELEWDSTGVLRMNDLLDSPGRACTDSPGHAAGDIGA